MSKTYDLKVSKADVKSLHWSGQPPIVHTGDTVRYVLGDEAAKSYRFAASHWIQTWQCTPSNLQAKDCLAPSAPMDRKELLLNVTATQPFQAEFTIQLYDEAGAVYKMDPIIIGMGD